LAALLTGDPRGGGNAGGGGGACAQGGDPGGGGGGGGGACADGVGGQTVAAPRTPPSASQAVEALHGRDTGGEGSPNTGGGYASNTGGGTLDTGGEGSPLRWAMWDEGTVDTARGGSAEDTARGLTRGEPVDTARGGSLALNEGGPTGPRDAPPGATLDTARGGSDSAHPGGIVSQFPPGDTARGGSDSAPPGGILCKVPARVTPDDDPTHLRRALAEARTKLSVAEGRLEAAEHELRGGAALGGNTSLAYLRSVLVRYVSSI